MTTKTTPAARKPRARRKAPVQYPEVKEEPKAEEPEVVEGETIVAEVEPMVLTPKEPQLPAVVHSTVDPGTTALALLSDDEFDQRLEMLAKGRERIGILQKRLLVKAEAGSTDGDYGTIPGTPKPTLFKSGAEKLCQFYGFVADIEVIFRAGDNITTPPLIFDALTRLHLGSTDGPVIATGFGTANSWEKRYLRAGNLKCPSCGKENLRKSKDKDEWYCWRRTAGCGSTYRLDDARITSQTVDPKGDAVGAYDLGVTLAKMAEKRSYVDATLRATATSGLFTQDIVEDENDDTRLDDHTTVTQGGAILDASTGEVTGRVDDGGYGADPEGPEPQEPLHPAMGPDSATAERIAETQAVVAETVPGAPYVATGDEVEKVLGVPDPMAEDDPSFASSNVEGVGRGGVTREANTAQIEAVKRLSKEHGLGPYVLIEEMMQRGVLDPKVGEAMKQIEDKKAAANALLARLEKLSGDELGGFLKGLREAYDGAKA